MFAFLELVRAVRPLCRLARVSSMGKQRRAGRARGGAQQRLPPGGDTHAAAAHLVAAPREWEELVPRGVFA